MCKDIHKWMTTSYLSNEDLSDEFVPIYFIFKNKDNMQYEDIVVYEYLKFFVHTNDNSIKTGFIQKGNDYSVIKEYIDKLIDNNYIKDLLNGEQYINYNLSCNEGTVNFLDKFLSLVLISEDQIGNELTFDISNYHENKNTYEYYMKTINSDITMFNTSL
jgi:alpha-glucosidase (family GH31 glycosyl hydrolase)